MCLPVKRIKSSAYLQYRLACKRRLVEKFIPISAYLHGEKPDYRDAIN